MASYASANRDHFDKTATTYDSMSWMQRANAQITGELRAHRDWLGNEWASSKDSSVRVLDYACGTGLVSRAFAPHATEFRGIDVSSSMAAEYNRRCSALSVEENPLGASMHAIVGDLCDPAGVAEEMMGKELFDFDLAIVGMGFHHFEHSELSIRRLVERVKVGGVVAIVDFAEGQRVGEGVLGAQENGNGHGHGYGHHDHGHDHGSKPEKNGRITEQKGGQNVLSVFAAAAPSIPHKHGFSRADMEKLFTAAGCTDFDMVIMEEPIIFGDGEGALRNKAFIAKAVRA